MTDMPEDTPRETEPDADVSAGSDEDAARDPGPGESRAQEVVEDAEAAAAQRTAKEARRKAEEAAQRRRLCLEALRALDDEALIALSESAEEAERMRSLAHRVRAEAENQRKRERAERDQLRLYYKREVLSSLMPVLSNFEQALAQGASLQSDEARNFLAGFRGLCEQFVRALEAMGCVAYRPEPGTPFDPAWHEALVCESSTEYPDNSVIETLSVGYKAGDALLRPARVRIAKHPTQG